MIVEVAGEEVELRADRSLFWPRRRTLIVADLHFGKADTFRAAAVPVPGGADETLARLDRAVDATAAERLVVLGDFWHARPGRTPQLVNELSAWRRARAALEVVLVRGNHDAAGPPPWADAWPGETADPPFAFAHYPDESPAGYVLAGHLHPGVRLGGPGRQSVRLPCFWLRDRSAVLPAFGSFTGSAAVAPTPGDRVFAIADAEVIRIPT